MNNIEKLIELKEELAKKTDFNPDRITIIRAEEFEIIIDDVLWSNTLSYEEVEYELRCLFKGIELGIECRIDAKKMTDEDIMNHRFNKKNIRKSTGELAKYLGISRQEYEAACKRAMNKK